MEFRKMDEWQKAVYDKMRGFIYDHSVFVNAGDLTIGVSLPEAYVIMKAFEDQQGLLRPLLPAEPPEQQG